MNHYYCNSPKKARTVLSTKYLILLNFIIAPVALAEDGTFLETTKWIMKWASQLWNYPLRVIDNNPITPGSLFVGFILILIGLRIAKKISRQLATKVYPRVTPDRASLSTFENLTFYGLLVFLTLFALKIANVPLTVFTVIGGAVAIGFGFGSQNLVNNFLSGIILMIERPIKVGDFVEMDQAIGTVEHIGIRSTQVLLADNRHMIVPNSSFLEKNVVNWTQKNAVLRLEVDVGVAYGSPTEQVAKLLLRSATETDKILKSPDPLVHFTTFGDNSLNFRVLFWIRVNKIVDRRTIESNVRFKIDNLFREAGIVISFPQRDVHLDTEKPIQVQMLPTAP